MQASPKTANRIVLKDENEVIDASNNYNKERVNNLNEVF
jgi:hypothetical protein